MLANEAQLKGEKGIGDDSALYAKRVSGGSGKRIGRQDTRATGPECFYCGKPGQKRFECHKFKADKASGNLKPRGTTRGHAVGKQVSGTGRGQSSEAMVTEDVMWVAREVCATARTPGQAAEST